MATNHPPLPDVSELLAMDTQLAAAGITDPALTAAYRECRRLNAEHGKTYYLATLLLPPAKRPFVHALYGFARFADEIVDAPAPDGTPGRQARLDALRADFAVAWRSGSTQQPVVAAVIDTARRWDIPWDTFDSFLDSMAMDLTVTQYETWADLQTYIYGSAAVIGLQMLPILEPSDTAAAREGAMRLGEAFQLANFIRDVAEDLDRGRIYLPLADLAAFGVTPQRLRRRIVDDDVRAAIAGAAGKPCSIRIVLEFTNSAVTRAIDDRRTLKGSPADVIEQIRGYADAGVSELVVDANSSDVEAIRACYRRFCEEVIAKL